jgi:hypothetical protein
MCDGNTDRNDNNPSMASLATAKLYVSQWQHARGPNNGHMITLMMMKRTVDIAMILCDRGAVPANHVQT